MARAEIATLHTHHQQSLYPGLEMEMEADVAAVKMFAACGPRGHAGAARGPRIF